MMMEERLTSLHATGKYYTTLVASEPLRPAANGLQLQSLWRIPTAAVSAPHLRPLNQQPGHLINKNPR